MKHLELTAGSHIFVQGEITPGAQLTVHVCVWGLLSLMAS